MQQGIKRRLSMRTAGAIALAVTGMLCVGGAWNAASADPGKDQGNEHANSDHDGQANNDGHDNGNYNGGNGHNDGHGNSCSNPAHDCGPGEETSGGGGGGGGSTPEVTPTTPDTPAVTPDQPSAEVLGETESKPDGAVAPSELARTGSMGEALGFGGAALLAFGGALVLVARRNEEALLPIS